jgi:hypothetical protein
MKIILSRKGFDPSRKDRDFTCGGAASPILPDGSLLSLPFGATQRMRRIRTALRAERAARLPRLQVGYVHVEQVPWPADPRLSGNGAAELFADQAGAWLRPALSPAALAGC